METRQSRRSQPIAVGSGNTRNIPITPDMNVWQLGMRIIIYIAYMYIAYVMMITLAEPANAQKLVFMVTFANGAITIYLIKAKDWRALRISGILSIMLIAAFGLVMMEWYTEEIFVSIAGFFGFFIVMLMVVTSVFGATPRNPVVQQLSAFFGLLAPFITIFLQLISTTNAYFWGMMISLASSGANILFNK